MATVRHPSTHGPLGVLPDKAGTEAQLHDFTKLDTRFNVLVVYREFDFWV